VRPTLPEWPRSTPDPAERPPCPVNQSASRTCTGRRSRLPSRSGVSPADYDSPGTSPRLPAFRVPRPDELTPPARTPQPAGPENDSAFRRAVRHLPKRTPKAEVQNRAVSDPAENAAPSSARSGVGGAAPTRHWPTHRATADPLAPPLPARWLRSPGALMPPVLPARAPAPPPPADHADRATTEPIAPPCRGGRLTRPATQGWLPRRPPTQPVALRPMPGTRTCGPAPHEHPVVRVSDESSDRIPPANRQSRERQERAVSKNRTRTWIES